MARQSTDAVGILCEGTMRAAALIIQSRHIDHRALDPDCTRITAALRQTLRENLEATLEEWREALDARPGEAWLRELLNAQCNSLALKALESLGWL